MTNIASDHEYFLKAINPKNVPPRLWDQNALLVYADWCDENDESEMAIALRFCVRHDKWPFIRLDGKAIWFNEDNFMTGDRVYNMDMLPGRYVFLSSMTFETTIEALRWYGKRIIVHGDHLT